MPRTESSNTPRRVRLRETGKVAKHHLVATRRVPMRKWSLELISTAAGIERLEADWRRLTPDGAAPFVTFAWNSAWFRAYGDTSVRPSIFRVEENGRTVAILPCYRRENTFRLAGDNICDYQDIVATDEESVDRALATIMLWLRKHAANCHFHFQKLSDEGMLYRALAARKSNERILSFEKRYAPCPYVDLQGGLENYLSSLPRKMRGDLRRALNRLDREAPCARVTISRDYAVRASDLESAAAFHVDYFRKNGTSPLADPRLVSLLGEVAKDPAVGFHLSHFTDQDETLAVDFGFARGGRYYGYLTGFNPDFRKLAPGKCLLLSRIDEWVAKDGVAVLDFLAGDEEYKSGFTGGECYHVNTVRLMPDRIRYRMLKSLLEADKYLRTLAKVVLRRAGYRSA